MNDGLEEMSETRPPIFEVHERNGKTYKIFADGNTEGFEDGAVIANGVMPWIDLAKGLAIKARDNGFISVEQAANILL